MNSEAIARTNRPTSATGSSKFLTIFLPIVTALAVQTIGSAVAASTCASIFDQTDSRAQNQKIATSTLTLFSARDDSGFETLSNFVKSTGNQVFYNERFVENKLAYARAAAVDATSASAGELEYLENLASLSVPEKVSDPKKLFDWNFDVEFHRILYKLKMRSPELPGGLTNSEIFAINYYTSTGYKFLNSSLRANKASPEILEFVKIIATAFHKLEPYEGIAIRLADISPARLLQMQVGADFTSAAFMSSSSVEGSFANEKSHALVIQSRSGRLIAPFSESPTENEVLFLPGSRFKVRAIEGRRILIDEIDFRE